MWRPSNRGHVVLRIHFTTEDLARTSLATAADPLWETLLSVFRLQERDQPLEFRAWSRTVRTRLTRVNVATPAARLLPVLTPFGPYIPDFLTPAEARHGLDAGLEAVLSTPKRRLRHELGRLAACSPVPDWVRPLADGDVAFLTRLTDELRECHETAVAPHHEVAVRCLEADRARRTRDFLEGGLEGLFNGLRPLVRWSPPVLEVDYAVDKDLYLAGRGLRIVPAFFSVRTPDSLADPDLSPVLVYPVDQVSRWTQISAAGADRSLTALMGATRAAVLASVEDGATTSQLARRLAASLPSISRHTSVLREAGLITTRRRGNAVLHALTPLGSALLRRHQILP